MVCRLVFSPGFCADLTAVLSGRDRHGAGSSQLSTLDLLLIGLVVISIFETLPRFLRTYVSAHHQSGRRRIGGAAASLLVGIVDRLLRGRRVAFEK